MNNNLKFILIGFAAAVVTMTLFMTMSNSWKLSEEEKKLQLQEELHRQAIGDNTFKKSKPFNIMDYSKPPKPADK